MKTGDGTRPLLAGARKCDQRRGVAVVEAPLAIEYSEARHRAMIAMRCCVHHRPFNFVDDPYYVQEVQMLRPNTKLPSPRTVSRDTVALYTGISLKLKEYMKVSLSFVVLLRRTDHFLGQHPLLLSHARWLVEPTADQRAWRCHPVACQWTDPPLHARVHQVSYIQVFAIMTSSCYHRLTSAHTGDYMAEKIYKLLEQYGLLLKVCLHLLPS